MLAAVEFTGRLTREPKKFQNNDGTKLRLLFSVACNTKTASTERVDFYPCIMWGDERIPKLQPWMLKGRMVHIRGELVTRDIRDDDNNFVRKDFEIVVRQFEFLDRKPEGVETPNQKVEGTSDQSAVMLQMMQRMVRTVMASQATNSEPAESAESAEPAVTTEGEVLQPEVVEEETGAKKAF